MFSDPSAIQKLMELQKQKQDPQNGMAPQPLQGQAGSTQPFAGNIPPLPPPKLDKGPIGALQGMTSNIPIAGQATQALMGVNDMASNFLGGVVKAPLGALGAAANMFKGSPTMALRNRYL